MLIGALLCSCNHNFLDVKPSTQSMVPVALEDFQGLADDVNLFNNLSVHSLGIIGGDEFYLAENQYFSLPAGIQNNYQAYAYIWDKEIYSGQELYTDWGNGYAKILQANVILEGHDKMLLKTADKERWNNIYGSALFHRANAYYGLAQLYCNVYNPTTAATDLGLPLRLESDPTLKVDRSNLQETYDLIIDDLQRSIDLLPPSPDLPNRPSKRASYALLTRVYMQMGDYKLALDYAQACLDINDNLTDFNDLDKITTEPFPRYGLNDLEMIFANGAQVLNIYASNRINVDTILYKMYDNTDLRKQIYFRNQSARLTRKGTYMGASVLFTGYANNELYLNLSECALRNGDKAKALNTLNKLLIKRYLKDTFIPIQSESEEAIWDIILTERRKELYLRGIRWEDMRRFNKEGKYPINVKRILGDQIFELDPGELAWTWPIPPQAIRIGGYQQNPR